MLLPILLQAFLVAASTWWYTWWLCFFIETSGIYTSVNTQATQSIDSLIAISTQLCILSLSLLCLFYPCALW
jgi:hypothetical protein